MDLALITAKQVFELFILILCGVVIGKIKMVNEEGKGMLSNLLIYFVVPFMIINSYMSGYNAEILILTLFKFFEIFIIIYKRDNTAVLIAICFK